MQWAQPPVEANRRGSWFFLTLEIVLRGRKGAIKKRKASHRRQVSRQAFPLYGRGVTPAPASARRTDPEIGAGPAGGTSTRSAAGERLRPGLAADPSRTPPVSGPDVTSYFFFFFFYLLWKTPRAFSEGETTINDRFLFP